MLGFEYVKFWAFKNVGISLKFNIGVSSNFTPKGVYPTMATFTVWLTPIGVKYGGLPFLIKDIHFKWLKFSISWLHFRFPLHQLNNFLSQWLKRILTQIWGEHMALMCLVEEPAQAFCEWKMHMRFASSHIKCMIQVHTKWSND